MYYLHWNLVLAKKVQKLTLHSLLLIHLLVPQQIHLFNNFGGGLLWCTISSVVRLSSLVSIFSTAFNKSSSQATNSGAFVHCHLRNRSKGPARVHGNSFIKHLWALAMKWIRAIASTNLIHLVGMYCNLSSNMNSWWFSWYQLTSMVTFHCLH